MLPWEAAQFGLLDDPTERAQTPYNPVADLFIDWAQGVGGRIGGLLEPDRYPEEDAEIRQQLQDTFLGNLAEGQLPEIGFGGTVVGAKSGLFQNHLRQAKNLEKKGYSRDEIFDWSGWWKGPDGKWRHELSDRDVIIPSQDLAPGLEKGKSRIIDLNDAMEHPILYEAYKNEKYPIDTIPINVRKDQFWKGGYNPVTKTMRVMHSPEGAEANPTALKRLLLHEVQHKIQDIEGFVQGANMKRAKTGEDAALLDLRAEIIEADPNLRAQAEYGARLLESGDPSKRAEGMQYIQSAHNEAGMRIYRGTLGEVEARTVAKRHLLHEYEQKAKPFYHYLDSTIPYNQQYNFRSLLD